MIRQIYVEPLQMHFDVNVIAANTEAKNKSYANASNCCKAPLKEKKYCSECGSEKDEDVKEPQFKLFKIGKGDVRPISAAAIKQAWDLDGKGELRISSVMKRMPQGVDDRFDRLSYLTPVKKKEQGYVMLQQLFTERVGMGTAIFGHNEFQILLKTGDDGVVRVWQLVSEARRVDFNPEGIVAMVGGVKSNVEMLALATKVLDKKAVKEYDVAAFVDRRVEQEQSIIEAALDGKLEQVMPKVVESKVQDDITKLKALLSIVG